MSSVIIPDSDHLVSSLISELSRLNSITSSTYSTAITEPFYLLAFDRYSDLKSDLGFLVLQRVGALSG